MDMSEIICPCVDVTVQDLADAIQNGASSYDEVVEVTGATQVCGVCEEAVRDVVEQLIK